MKPIDEKLFALFSDAIRVALDYVQRRKDSGGYIGTRHDWPTLTWHENGMPWLGNALNGPVDYADALRPPIAFGTGAMDTKNFDSEPSSSALIDYAASHGRISKHFMAAEYPDMMRTSLRMLIGDLLDRYIHTTGLAKLEAGKLLELYLPIEAYLLNDKLEVEIWIPILCLKFEPDLVQIDARTSLRKLTDEIQLARTPDWKYQYGSDPRVQTAATHALVLSNYTIQNENQPQMWHSVGDPDNYPLRVIDRFFGALRLKTGYATGYAQLLVLPIGWADRYKNTLLPIHKASVKSYPPFFENGYWNADLPSVDEAALQCVVLAYHSIEEVNNKRVEIALRRLNLSELRVNAEDRLLDTMIGIEALLSEATQEMTFKVAMRMAALYKVQPHPAGGFDVLREMKSIYGQRSKVVHGADYDLEKLLERPNSKVRVVDAAIEHLRLALSILLDHPEFLDVSQIDQEVLLGYSTH